MSKKSKFICQKKNCQSSCCGAYNGFSDKLASVDGRSFMEILLTTQDLQRLHGTQYEKYIFIGEDGLGRVRTADDGVCSAYQSGQCAMNNIKPTICQCFPLYLDLFIGLCTIKSCPSIKDGLSFEDYSDEVKHFINMCEFWVSYYKKELSKYQKS